MTDRPESDQPAAGQQPAGEGQVRPAQKGVKDTDAPVHTFGGERVDGAVADTTDGEYGIGGLFKGKKK